MRKLRECYGAVTDENSGKSFEEVYGDGKMFESTNDDLINPKMKKLFESAYRDGQLTDVKVLRENNEKQSERLREAKKDGICVGNGVTAYCRKSKYGSKREPTFDLILEGPKGKRVVEEWAGYRTGYNQTGGFSRSEMGYYLVTQSGYNAGNGDGISKPTVPYLKGYRYLNEHIEEKFARLIKEVSGSIEDSDGYEGPGAWKCDDCGVVFGPDDEKYETDERDLCYQCNEALEFRLENLDESERKPRRRVREMDSNPSLQDLQSEFGDETDQYGFEYSETGAIPDDDFENSKFKRFDSMDDVADDDIDNYRFDDFDDLDRNGEIEQAARYRAAEDDDFQDFSVDSDFDGDDDFEDDDFDDTDFDEDDGLDDPRESALDELAPSERDELDNPNFKDFDDVLDPDMGEGFDDELRESMDRGSRKRESISSMEWRKDFRPGERVLVSGAFRDEEYKGTIIEVGNDDVYIKTDDGQKKQFGSLSWHLEKLED